MLKEVLMDHNDLDGAGCRIVFEIAHLNHKKGIDYEVIHCSNNDVDDKTMETMNRDDVDENTQFFFSDICASLEVLRIIKNFTKKEIVIWDHHPTNFPATQVVPDAMIIPKNALNVLQAGTSVMYCYYCERAMDANEINEAWGEPFRDQSTRGRLFSKFVDTVRSYDTFEFKETGNIDAKKMQMLFFMLGLDRFCNKYIKRIIDAESDELITPGDMEFIDAKMEFEQKVIDNMSMDSIIDINVRGYRTAFTITPMMANISEVAYQFLQKHPEFDMFASFSLARGGEFSFRTQREDLDTGAVIADPIGGGGHPKASGSPFPEYMRDILIDMLNCHMNGSFWRSESWWED